MDTIRRVMANTVTNTVSKTVSRPDSYFDAYIFDMDGTIFLGDHLLPGVKDFIEELRDHEIPVRYLTNNPTKNPSLYAEKLTRLGLPTTPNEIATTVAAVTTWLTSTHPGKVVYPIAEDVLITALRDAGIRISDNPEEIDIVVASYDRTFTYEKLQIAFDAIWFHRRAILVATNPDRYCPYPGGRGEPDCASIVAAIEACTGTRCQMTVGKPNPAMIEAVIGKLGVDARRCIMVGDRLHTDIAMAARAGIPSALVLTGDSSIEDLDTCAQGELPTYVLNRLDDLRPVQ